MTCVSYLSKCFWLHSVFLVYVNQTTWQKCFSICLVEGQNSNSIRLGRTTRVGERWYFHLHPSTYFGSCPPCNSLKEPLPLKRILKSYHPKKHRSYPNKTQTKEHNHATERNTTKNTHYTTNKSTKNTHRQIIPQTNKRKIKHKSYHKHINKTKHISYHKQNTHAHTHTHTNINNQNKKKHKKLPCCDIHKKQSHFMFLVFCCVVWFVVTVTSEG